MRAAAVLVLSAAALLIILRVRYNSDLEAESARARAKLQGANLELQAELRRARLQQQELQTQLEVAREHSRLLQRGADEVGRRAQGPAGAAASSQVAGVPANSSAAAAHAALESDPLLEVHRHWDWASIAKDMLYPFESIDKRMLREGIKPCFDNATMYCQRIQVSTAAYGLVPTAYCLLPTAY